MRMTCSKCGAVYEVEDFHSPVRDKDSLECEFCGETLIKWNGSTYYEIKDVVKKPDKTEKN